MEAPLSVSFSSPFLSLLVFSLPHTPFLHNTACTAPRSSDTGDIASRHTHTHTHKRTNRGIWPKVPAGDGQNANRQHRDLGATAFFLAWLLGGLSIMDDGNGFGWNSPRQRGRDSAAFSLFLTQHAHAPNCTRGGFMVYFLSFPWEPSTPGFSFPSFLFRPPLLYRSALARAGLKCSVVL